MFAQLKIKLYICKRNKNKIMKYIRIISTLILLVYIAHLSDTIYVEYFKPTLETMSGFSKVSYALFLFIPRLVFGVVLGTNLVRISNFIWDKND